MCKNLSSALRDQSGATAIIYALVMLPLMAGVGLAIDLSRAQSGKNLVQSAVDSSALAATRHMSDATKTDAEVIAMAVKFYQADIATAHSGLDCATPTVALNRAEGTIDVTANCRLPTTLAGLVGVSEFQFSESARAQAAITTLDLALVVDVSGSMGGTRLANLQAAASTAIDQLVTPEAGDRVRVAVAPYSHSVNVSGYESAVFEDAVKREWVPASGGNPGYWNMLPGGECATERSGDEAISDAEPDTDQWIGREADTCPVNSILPLTSNKTDIQNAIDALVADGGTAGHLGVAWGGYLLAPTWVDVWPAASTPKPYNNNQMIKAVILMTDGAFNTAYDSALGSSFEQAENMCTEMKTNGILIFSVAFQAPAEGEAIMQACATEPGMYFDASSGADLVDAYDSIASSLEQLSLKH